MRPKSTVPTLTLLQQHMDVSELREMVLKLSDNQASMMDFLQSLIEPHPDRNLDFSHGSGANDPTNQELQANTMEDDFGILGYRFDPTKRMTAAEVRKFNGDSRETGRNWIKNFKHHAKNLQLEYRLSD